jgi:hypothetical protein
VGERVQAFGRGVYRGFNDLASLSLKGGHLVNLTAAHMIAGFAGSQAAEDFATSIYVNEFQEGHLALKAIAALEPAEKLALAASVGQHMVSSAAGAVSNAYQNISEGCYGAVADDILELAGQAIPELMLGAKGLQRALHGVCFTAGTQVVIVVPQTPAELSAADAVDAEVVAASSWERDKLLLAAGCGVLTIGFWIKRGGCQRPGANPPAQAASATRERLSGMKGTRR